jgi:hypothetical protein
MSGTCALQASCAGWDRNRIGGDLSERGMYVPAFEVTEAPSSTALVVRVSPANGALRSWQCAAPHASTAT